MEIPFMTKKQAPKRDPNRCAFHYYRPKVAECPTCGTPICQECRTMTASGLCRTCAVDPVGQEAAEGTAPGAAAPQRKARYAKKPQLKKKKEAAIPQKKKTRKRRLSSETIRKRIVIAVFCVLFPVLLALLVLTYLGYSPFYYTHIPQKSTADRQTNLKRFVLFAVEGIDNYKKKNNGRLPSNLSDIGITDLQNWEYVVNQDGTYKIAAKDGDQRFFYDSTLDKSSILAKAPAGAGRKK